MYFDGSYICMRIRALSLSLSHTHMHTHAHTHTHTHQDALTLRQVAQDGVKRLQNAWLGPKKPRRVHGSILFQPPLLGTGTTGGGVGEGGGEGEGGEGGEGANKEMTPVRALFEAVKGCMVSFTSFRY